MSKRNEISKNLNLMKQWDYEKNSLDPLSLTEASQKSAWWICDNGHSWFARVECRSRGNSCPYCSGHKVLFGTNDLQTLNPLVASEWDFKKNKITPSEVTSYSHKKVWWVCNKGHSWQAMIFNRVNGNSCPYCTGKKVLTGVNDLQTLKPIIATQWDFEKNTLPPTETSAKSSKKAWWKCDKGHCWEAVISSRDENSSCPYCLGRRIIVGINDLQTLRPMLVSEWDFEKNTILPTMVSPQSNKYAWWICSKGHSWNTIIFNRNAGRGCPYCSGQKTMAGFNDLQTLYPHLASQWDCQRNMLKPSEVTQGSNKVVWWKCAKGHSWKSAVSARVQGGECPYCLGKVQYKPKCVR